MHKISVGRSWAKGRESETDPDRCLVRMHDRIVMNVAVIGDANGLVVGLHVTVKYVDRLQSVKELMRVPRHLIEFNGSIKHLAYCLHFDIISMTVRMALPGDIFVKFFGNVLREIITVLRHIIHA